MILWAFGAFSGYMILKALSEATATLIIERPLDGWGPTISAEFDRDDHPVGYWFAAGFYALCALGFFALGLYLYTRGG
jgi:hypothetical protein